MPARKALAPVALTLLSALILHGCADGTPSRQAIEGNVLVTIHDTAPEDLTAFFVTIEEVRLAGEAGDHRVFPPASEPAAAKTIDLARLREELAVIVRAELPKGTYDRVELRFDGAFARRGADAVLVVPDAGALTLPLDPPLKVKGKKLARVTIDFDLTASLRDGGDGKVLLEPVVSASAARGPRTTPLAEFRATVLGVDLRRESFIAGLSAPQASSPEACAALTVKVTKSTQFDMGSLGPGGLVGPIDGMEVEVEGLLNAKGVVLATDVELRLPGSPLDLNDDGLDDSLLYPDRDTDIDNDGIPNNEDDDVDGDGIPNDQDDDDDNDGIPDDEDGDDDGDGTPDDHDGDGVSDFTDNCPTRPNPGQEDRDSDDHGDLCDNCPLAANPDQADSDGDGIGNACDNCPLVANPDQADSDGDGAGNACDDGGHDDDGDDDDNDDDDGDGDDDDGDDDDGSGPPRGKPCRKIRALRIEYSGADCGATTHDHRLDRVVCEDVVSVLPERVFIVVSDKNDLDARKRYFEGVVARNESFTVDSEALRGKSKLKPRIFVFVCDADGVTLLQRLEIRTNCAALLEPGDSVGSLIVREVVPERKNHKPSGH
jgi:hypothetical protein